jgi:hypothetical protein
MPDRAQGRIRAQPLDVISPGVDGIDRAAESVADEVGHQGGPDAGRITRSADHGHRARVKERAHALAGRVPGPFVAGAPRLRRGLDGEPGVHDARARVLVHVEAERDHDVEHLPVRGQDVGLEPLDPVGGCDAGQVLHEQRAHPAALPGVHDGQRELGPPAVVFGADVTADADELLLPLLPAHRHQADVPGEIELREVAQLRRRQVLLRAQEAEAHGIEPEPVEMRLQALLVVGADGTDVDGAAVTEERVRGVTRELARHGRVARDPVQPCRIVM